MKRGLGVAIIALALAIVVTPQFLKCPPEKMANGTTMIMPCNYTASAEIATGVPILAVGSMLVFIRKKESLRYLGLVGVILGAFVILLPTSLTGVCSGPMPCRTVMKPSLLTFGSLVIVTSVTGMVSSFKKGE